MLRALFGLLLFVSPLHAETITGASAGGGSGTVTSISAGCGSSTGGSAITTTGTIAAVEPVDAAGTGSNYAIPNSDCGYLVNLSNASAQTPTIAQAGAGGNFTAGWYADVCNIGAGAQTLTPATSTIGGNASQVISQGQCIRVVSDGTNYQIDPGSLSMSSAGVWTLNNGGNTVPQLVFQPNSGVAIGLGEANGGGNLSVFVNGAPYTNLSNFITFSAPGGLIWSNANANPNTTTDIGIFRYAAGIAEVNNSGACAGTPANCRDLILRHVGGGNTAPTANSCAGFALGTGGSDLGGIISLTSATTCSVTFGSAFTNAPACVITPASALSTTEVVATTGGFTATFGTAQTKFNFVCVGL